MLAFSIPVPVILRDFGLEGNFRLGCGEGEKIEQTID